MLRLSKLTDYGTVAMAQFAREPDRIYAAAGLAAVIDVPVPTASKILKMLARAGLLRSVLGAKGGYMLSRPAAAISIVAIIDAMEGPLGVTECGAALGLCAREKSCSIRANWQRINGVIRAALTRMTLADLARPAFKPAPLPALAPVRLDVRRTRRQAARA